MRPVALLVLAVVLCAFAAAACTSEQEEPEAPTVVEGRVVEVRGAGSAVRSLLVEADGERHELRIDPAVDYGFDLAHLHEHARTGDPVHCRVEERGGVLYALEIHDA